MTNNLCWVHTSRSTLFVTQKNYSCVSHAIRQTFSTIVEHEIDVRSQLMFVIYLRETLNLHLVWTRYKSLLRYRYSPNFRKILKKFKVIHGYHSVLLEFIQYLRMIERYFINTSNTAATGRWFNYHRTFL